MENTKTAFGRFLCAAQSISEPRLSLHSESSDRMMFAWEECIMRSNGPAFVCAVLALAFAVIVYVATPPGVLKQATAFLGF
jgi:hypothetical protein